MTMPLFAMIMISVLLSVTAQILLKHGMSHQTVSSASEGPAIVFFINIFSNISVLSGLTAYVASAGVWLLVLGKIDVSKAYPFVGLGFVLTMLFAHLFLGESLSILKVIGTLLIFAGVVLISQS